MGSQLLEVSALGIRLLELGAAKATGRVALGARAVLLVNGEVADVLPSPQDESLEHFLSRSGRVPEAAIAQYEQAAKRERVHLTDLLVQHGVLSASELRHSRRAVLVERLTRALRSTAERGEVTAVLEPSQASTEPRANVGLTSLLLDALARAAASADAGVVGSHLNHRIEWLPGPHQAVAREWADFGDGPQRPAVSTVLAKRPAAAPRIAALLRAGLIRIDPPGRAVPSHPPAPGTLPPPAPRLSPIAGLARADERVTEDPLAQLESIKPPRPRLDPSQVYAGAQPLEPTALPALSPASEAFEDPLVAIERRIAELETGRASGPERARAFSALADIWRVRFGSLERACRAFREAAAADPADSSMLGQAALHCHYLGENELAVRYAAGAVAAASIPIERASIQRLRANIERAAGNVEACVEALCEAAADDPESPDPHEQVAALLLERGDVEGANAHARLAATSLQDDAPERALGLLAWAWSLTPADVPTAYEYASLLDTSGRRPAAVAVLADTANRCADQDQRRKLRLAAAERAEAAKRADIAAELLEAAFDAEPHFDLLYGALDEDLAAQADRERRATLLEDIATVCAEEQRGHWLTLAGQAMLQVDGQHEAALWLLFEALLTDAHKTGPLEALRTHARGARGLALLADGLRAAIAANLDDDPKRAMGLLVELADLAEQRLDNPDLALAALTELERIGSPPSSTDTAARCARFRARIDARRVELESAERELAATAAQSRARGEASRKVAALLPDLPPQRPRRIQLLSEALAAGIAKDATRGELETLLGLTRDVIALATFLEDQAELSHDSAERSRLLARLCEVHTVREDTAAVASTCELLLAADPGCRIASARLERAARRLGDSRRLARALSLRAAVTRAGLEHARVLAQLARAEEQSGSFGEATLHATQALREDPDAVDAGFLLLRHAHRIAPSDALDSLQALAHAAGAGRALLVSITQTANACSDQAALRRAVETWVELLPSDGAAHRAYVLLLADGTDAGALLAAAERALAVIPSAEVLDAALAALERLEALAAPQSAARLALRIAEEQGRVDAGLARRAVELSRRSGSVELLTRALELQAGLAAEATRQQALLELAAHHRSCGDRAGEARALLRVLEAGTRHATSLARLRELFSTPGEAARMLAVVALMAESETEPARRCALQLELSAIAGQLLHDPERAEHYLRASIAENADDPAAVRSALGALFSLGTPTWALARCQAIADDCPPLLASRIYLCCALTAEQSGDAALALTIARTGALRWPSYAEPLLAVERLTLAARDVRCAMDTYDALLAAACGPHGRRALLYRAGRWLEQAGLPDRALERYLAAFELAPTSGAAFKALQRVGRKTGRLERVIPCYELLAEQVRENRARFSLLCEAAELCERELGDLRRSFDLLLQANVFSEGAELDQRLLQTGLTLREQDPAAGTEALQTLAEQIELRVEGLWNAEDKVRALLLLGTVYGAGLDQHEHALGHVDAALAIVGQEQLPQSLHDEAKSLRSAVLARCPSEFATTAPPEPAPAEVAQSPAAAAAVEPTPAVPAAEPTVAQSTTQSESDIRQLLQSEPISVARLRALYVQRLGSEAASELHVLRQVLGMFDAEIPPPRDVEFHSGLWRSSALRDAIGPGQAPDLARFLAMLWEFARVIPRFRNPLANHGVSERDRISRITVGPAAEAYAQAARALDRTDVPVYVVATKGAWVRTLATHPPAVLAGRSVPEERAALQYGMAHALWLAQPEYVVGGVLGREDAIALLEAAQQAFAPDTSRGAPSSAAKELAAALWQSVPMREQRPMTEALHRNQHALDYEALRAGTRALAARAALLASGGLGAALRALPTMEPELTGLDLAREQDFALGCERSAALSQTVRCALSTPYLSVLSQALRSELRTSRV
jgi:hypothetical protein